MADFSVTGVKYNQDHSHIEYVEVRRDFLVNKELKVGAPRIVPRAFVADLINSGKVTFHTRVYDGHGTWWKGSDIHVIDGVYLTTDPNKFKRDNLENLPEF